MVYNQERLSRALQLFHLSAPYRTKRGLRADNLDRHLSDWADKYQLRFSSDVTPASASLWLDHDDSGDYNPTGKQASTVVHIPMKRRRVAAEDREKELEGRKNGSKNKKTKVNTWIKGRQNGEQLVVTFTIKTDAGKALLRNLNAAESGKDDYWSDDDAGPSEWSQMGGKFAKRPSSTSQTYALRNKTELTPQRLEELELLVSPKKRKSKLPSHCISNSVGNQTRRSGCRSCRTNRVHCSLKEKRGPCEACAKARISCSFGEGNSDEMETEVPTDNVSFIGNGNLLTPPSPANPVLEISTSWAHPVNFKHIGSEESPCDFCDDYRYGMFGLGKVGVRVRKLADDIGFEELKGGHRAQGLAQTKMCRSCALERLNIVRCSHRTIEALPDLDEDEFNFATAKQDLLATGTEKKQVQFLWCSICISPAFYACLTPQDTDMDDKALAQWSEESYGCGLVLCRECAGILDALNGNLDAAANYFYENPNLRADFDLLLTHSDLVLAYDRDD